MGKLLGACPCERLNITRLHARATPSRCPWSISRLSGIEAGFGEQSSVVDGDLGCDPALHARQSPHPRRERAKSAAEVAQMREDALDAVTQMHRRLTPARVGPPGVDGPLSIRRPPSHHSGATQMLALQ